jgi:hypothetical protein
MALKVGGQQTLTIRRLGEIARTCIRQGRHDAAEAIKGRIAEASKRKNMAVRYDELTLPEQETVDWVESLGNRQS